MLRANAAAESSGASTEAQTADLIRFIVPTLAALLSSEVMSVVDTAVVGSCSATELAALGPATMLVDSSAYLFFWLNVATTSLFATALAAGDQNEAFSTLSDALYVALLCGLGVSVFIACLGPATLQLICASALEVVPAATRYLRIRMFGYPAFLVGLVLQAACLGAKDSLSPLLVLLVCGALNLGLDLVLVRSCGMGIGGAAIATLAAQLLQTALLAYVVQRKKRRGVAAAAAVATSASPVLASQGPQWLLLRGRPSLPRIRTFLAFAGPMALVLMGKIACYNSMTCADQRASNPSHPTLHTLPFTPSLCRARSVGR
jgi:Na+-driven multidrug efflux pump